MENLPKTYGEAVAVGYTVVDRKIQLIYPGNRAIYVSRKARLEDAPIQVGAGRRAGQLYVWHNDRVSNHYSVRLYLAKQQ